MSGFQLNKLTLKCHSWHRRRRVRESRARETGSLSRRMAGAGRNHAIRCLTLTWCRPPSWDRSWGIGTKHRPSSLSLLLFKWNAFLETLLCRSMAIVWALRLSYKSRAIRSLVRPVTIRVYQIKFGASYLIWRFDVLVWYRVTVLVLRVYHHSTQTGDSHDESQAR